MPTVSEYATMFLLTFAVLACAASVVLLCLVGRILDGAQAHIDNARRHNERSRELLDNCARDRDAALVLLEQARVVRMLAESTAVNAMAEKGVAS